VREGGRIVSVAAIIAVAVSTEGKREIVGLGLGPSEAETFWSAFLKGLLKRGLALRRLLAASPSGIGSRASWPLMGQAGDLRCA
jgi:transposase-like protein